jgi:hypothetical protein
MLERAPPRRDAIGRRYTCWHVGIVERLGNRFELASRPPWPNWHPIQIPTESQTTRSNASVCVASGRGRPLAEAESIVRRFSEEISGTTRSFIWRSGIIVNSSLNLPETHRFEFAIAAPARTGRLNALAAD